MRARIGSREVEIDENRVRGGVENTQGCPSRTLLGGPQRSLAGKRILDTPQEPETIPAPAHPYRSAWEARYAQHLEILKRAGEIIDYWYEPIRFRLPGEANYYKSDFLIQFRSPLAPGFYHKWIEVHEVKGWSKNRREGITKLKTAAGLNPWATFQLVQWDRTQQQWVTQLVE